MNDSDERVIFSKHEFEGLIYETEYTTLLYDGNNLCVDSPKLLLLCSTKKVKSYRFETNKWLIYLPVNCLFYLTFTCSGTQSEYVAWHHSAWLAFASLHLSVTVFEELCAFDSSRLTWVVSSATPLCRWKEGIYLSGKAESHCIFIKTFMQWNLSGDQHDRFTSSA